MSLCLLIRVECCNIIYSEISNRPAIPEQGNLWELLPYLINNCNLSFQWLLEEAFDHSFTFSIQSVLLGISTDYSIRKCNNAFELDNVILAMFVY